jgi:hypothetical protein
LISVKVDVHNDAEGRRSDASSLRPQHEDDIGQDDAGHGDEGFDEEELMHNVTPDVLL